MPSKKTTTTKTISDVSRPGKSSPDSTSRPVIITNRPIMKDPMMLTKKDAENDKDATPVTVKTSVKPKLQPLVAEKQEDTTEKEVAAKTEPATVEEEIADPVAPPASDVREGDTIKDPAKTVEDEEKQEAEHAAVIQKLVDSKEYYLPINSVEKRRTKRVLAAGVVISIALALAWLNISLDAGLLEIQGVQPLTHFF